MPPSTASTLSAGYVAAALDVQDETDPILFGAIYGGTNTGILLAQTPATIAAGSYVTNTGGSGSGAAIYGASGTAWALTNYGTIVGQNGNGVLFEAGGTVTNLGQIRSNNASSSAVFLNNGVGHVINSGTIENIVNQGGTSESGVHLFAGTVTNLTGGLIEAQLTGIVIGTGTNGSLGGGSGTVINNGTIQQLNGSSGAAVYLAAGGTVTNGSPSAITARISAGRNGVVVEHVPGTVVNYATIKDTSSVINSGSLFGSGVLLAAGGTVINGSRQDNAALITSSEFGVYSGGIEGLATVGNLGTIINFGTIAATGLANLAVPGVELTAGGTVANYGTITAVGDAVRLRSNGGNVNNHLGGVISGGVGVVVTGGNATIINNSTIVGQSGTAVSLAPGTDLVVVEPGAAFVGAITGFGASDTIDFAQVKATGVTFGSNILTLTNNGTVVEQLSLPGTFASQNFAITSDGSGGSDISIRYITGTYTSTVVVAASVPTTVEATGVVSVTQGAAIVNQAGSAATVGNIGTIAASGAAGAGVSLNAGGIVTNVTSGAASGLISGYAAGVALSGGGGTVVNSSLIKSTGSSGVGVLLGASVASPLGAASAYLETLANTGTISGATGIIAAGSNDTISNAGTILGSAGTAVALAGGNDRLVFNPVAAFRGIVNGGGGNSVLELTGPSNPGSNAAAQYIGTLTGIGSSFVNFGTLVVDPGADWEASGNGGSYRFTNDGTIIVANGIVAGGETLALGALGEDPGDSGVIAVSGGGVAQLTGAVAGGQTVIFDDATGKVLLAQASGFAGAITGFQVGDVIDLGGATGIAGYAGGVLSVDLGGSGTFGLRLALAVPSANPNLVASSDGDGGILVSEQTVVKIKSTFSGTYHSGLVLSNTASNPATVTASAYVGNSGVALLGTAGTAWTLTNYGAIYGSGNTGVGVALQSGGHILNHGSIAGRTLGVSGYGGATTVLNYGAVTSAGGTGVELAAGSSLNNTSTITGGSTGVDLATGSSLNNTGTITGGSTGVYLATGDSLVNAGTITGGGTGVDLAADSSLVNVRAITSTGGTGVKLAADSTLVNAGTITGGGGTAVQFAGAGDLLVADPGSVFTGAVAGAGDSTLELAAGGYGSFSSYLTGFSGIDLDAGALWSLAGDLSAATIANSGTLLVDNGNLAVFGAFAGAQGVIEIAGYGVADFTAAVAGNQTLLFADNQGWAQLSEPKTFTALIEGFQPGDVIDLVGVAVTKDSYKNGKLTLSEGSKKVAVLSFAGTFTKGDFLLSADANGGTYVMLKAGADPTPSFAASLGERPAAFWTASG